MADWGPIEVATGSVRRIGDYSHHAQVDGLSRDGRNVLVGDCSVELNRHWRVDVTPYAGGRARPVADTPAPPVGTANRHRRD